jgi:hypothetical protein
MLYTPCGLSASEHGRDIPADPPLPSGAAGRGAKDFKEGKAS